MSLMHVLECLVGICKFIKCDWSYLFLLFLQFAVIFFFKLLSYLFVTVKLWLLHELKYFETRFSSCIALWTACTLLSQRILNLDIDHITIRHILPLLWHKILLEEFQIMIYAFDVVELIEFGLFLHIRHDAEIDIIDFIIVVVKTFLVLAQCILQQLKLT